MKSSVTICARREPGLLAYITGELFYRGLFPDKFSSEVFGIFTVLIRLEVACDAPMLEKLLAYWRSLHGVQSVVAVHLDEGIPLPTDASADAAKG